MEGYKITTSEQLFGPLKRGRKDIVEEAKRDWSSGFGEWQPEQPDVGCSCYHSLGTERAGNSNVYGMTRQEYDKFRNAVLPFSFIGT